jgi:hypothetical protein
MYEFYKNYLSINLADYENIKINLQISLVLLGLLIGVIIAAIFVTWHRNSMIKLIGELKKGECFDEDSAKTLSELNINTPGIRTLIKMSGRIGRLICRVGVKEYTYEEYVEITRKKKKRKNKEDINEPEEAIAFVDEKIDFTEARFYIKDISDPETANILDKKISSPLNTALMCLLLVSIYTILLFLMPDILSFINSILG